MIFSPTNILKKLLFSFCTPSYVVDPMTVAIAMQAVGKISQILGKDTDYPTAFGKISFKNGVASVVSNNAHAYDKGSLADAKKLQQASVDHINGVVSSMDLSPEQLKGLTTGAITVGVMSNGRPGNVSKGGFFFGEQSPGEGFLSGITGQNQGFNTPEEGITALTKYALDNAANGEKDWNAYYNGHSKLLRNWKKRRDKSITKEQWAKDHYQRKGKKAGWEVPSTSTIDPGLRDMINGTLPNISTKNLGLNITVPDTFNQSNIWTTGGKGLEIAGQVYMGVTMAQQAAMDVAAAGSQLTTGANVTNTGIQAGGMGAFAADQAAKAAATEAAKTGLLNNALSTGLGAIEIADKTFSNKIDNSTNARGTPPASAGLLDPMASSSEGGLFGDSMIGGPLSTAGNVGITKVQNNIIKDTMQGGKIDTPDPSILEGKDTNIPFDEYETPATKANNTGQIGQDSFKKINDVWTKVGIPIDPRLGTTDNMPPQNDPIWDEPLIPIDGVPGGLIGLPNDGGITAKPTPVGLLSTETKRLADLKALRTEAARVADEKRIATEKKNLSLAEEQRSRNELAARNKAEKLAAEKEKTRIESERVRLAAEQKQIETDRLAVEQVETDRLAAEQAEQVRIESERISAQTVEDGRVAAEQEAERTAVGSGSIAPYLLSPITENELSLATPGLAEAASDAIDPTFSSDITPEDGLIGVPGADVAPYVPITASDLTLSPPGIGEASADLVDSIDLGNGTTVGSKVGEMEGTFPAVETDGGTTAGLSGTIAGLINTAGTGNEFGLPGLIGDQLANPVYDNLINNIKNPPTDWWGIAKKALPFAPFIKPLINSINPPKTTQPKPFQFTPFNSTPVNAPETQRVFPQGGYYQQQANSMVPGGGQQMPTPEQYQGLLNSAFSRRV